MIAGIVIGAYGDARADETPTTPSSPQAPPTPSAPPAAKVATDPSPDNKVAVPAPPPKKDNGEMALDQVRMLASGSTFWGTKLVETGSIGKYRLGGGSLELDVDRFFGRLGFGFRLEGLPWENLDVGYVRGEAYGGVVPLRWGREHVGSLALFAGLGGDGGRYWYAEDGRFFGIARIRLRVWPAPEIPFQATYVVMPAAYTGKDVYLHDHRLELAAGWKLLTFGARVGGTFAHGGEPNHLFWQAEIGTFVGFGLMP